MQNFDENKILHIYRKAARIASGPVVIRSLRYVSSILYLRNTEQFEKDIEKEILSRNRESAKPDSRLSHSSQMASKLVNDWNYPFNSQKENEYSFYFLYNVSLIFDFIFRLKRVGHEVNPALKIYRNGELVAYRNPMLKGRRIPVTNLRFLAKRSIVKGFVAFLMVFLIFKIFIN